MIFPNNTLLTLLISLCLSANLARAQTRILFQETFEPKTTNHWQQVKFEALTDYQIVQQETNHVLSARSQRAASAFATKLEIPSGTNLFFSWRWQIDRCPTNGSDTKAKTFDHTGRIFVAFDTFIGPPKVINYVWANHSASNAVFDHPLSSRTKFITIRTGNTDAGKWWSESRSLGADWARLFPGEKMPKIVGIGVFTNSDGSEAPVQAWYDDVLLEIR